MRNPKHQYVVRNMHAGCNKTLLFARYFIDEVIKTRCFDHSAVLTVVTLMALVPLMTVAFSILSNLPGVQALGASLQTWLFAQLVPSRTEEILLHLQTFSAKTSGLTVIGGVLLLITALSMLSRVERCFNDIWHVKEQRPGLTSFLRYWAVLSLGPVFLGVGFGVTSYVASLKLVDDTMDALGVKGWILSILPLIFTFSGFFLLYLTVPNTRVPYRSALGGALCAAVLFEIAKGAFTAFVTQFPSYEMMYGAFAALPIFIVWLQLSWFILCVGVVMTRCLARYQAAQEKIPDPVILLATLECFWKEQTIGNSLSDEQVLEIIPELGLDQWERIRNLLLNQQMLAKTDQGRFVLIRDLDQWTQAEFLDQFGWWLVPDNKKIEINSEAVQNALDFWITIRSQHHDELAKRAVTNWFIPKTEIIQPTV
ncbi:MAG: YihY family inner membrane protein [Pseudomonadota bacterium]